MPEISDVPRKPEVSQNNETNTTDALQRVGNPSPPERIAADSMRQNAISDHSSQRAATDAAKANRVRDYSPEEMLKVWNEQVAANNGKPLSIIKGYYPTTIDVVQADEPKGRLLSSSENPMQLKTDAVIAYPDGTSINLRAGTLLPNGVQLSPQDMVKDGKTRTLQTTRLLISDNGTVTLADGTVLSSGGTIGGVVIIENGQKADPGDGVVARRTTDLATGEARLDTFPSNPKFWSPVPGTVGSFAPKLETAPAIPVVQAPADMDGTFKAAWGETVPVKPGDFLAAVEKTGPDGTKVLKFRRLSLQDTLETYLGADDSSSSAMEHARQELSTRFPDAQISRPFRSAEQYELINAKGELRTSAADSVGTDKPGASAEGGLTPRDLTGDAGSRPDIREALQRDEELRLLANNSLDPDVRRNVKELQSLDLTEKERAESVRSYDILSRKGLPAAVVLGFLISNVAANRAKAASTDSPQPPTFAGN